MGAMNHLIQTHLPIRGTVHALPIHFLLAKLIGQATSHIQSLNGWHDDLVYIEGLRSLARISLGAAIRQCDAEIGGLLTPIVETMEAP